jgi:hypothetical protein
VKFADVVVWGQFSLKPHYTQSLLIWSVVIPSTEGIELGNLFQLFLYNGPLPILQFFIRVGILAVMSIGAVLLLADMAAKSKLGRMMP